MYGTTSEKTDSLEQKYSQLEENLKMLTEKEIRLEIKQKSQTKKIKSHERRMDEVEENMKILTERVEDQTEMITTQFNKTNQITATIKEINQKDILETKENIRTLFQNVNDNDASIRELVEKQLKLTSNLETLGHKNMKLEWKQAAICQVLARRYRILDSVKGVLSKISLSRDEAYLKFHDKIAALEKKNNAHFEGFSAYGFFEEMTVVLSEFSPVHFNIGDNFNPKTGVFTIPTTGVYCMSLVLLSDYETGAEIEIILQVPREKLDVDEYNTDTTIQLLRMKGDRSTFVTYKYFEEGEKMFLQYKANRNLSGFVPPYHVTFTCYKIYESTE
ncbi:uncharacterized protein LOC131948813 [Physella acuta]|uniref:uncharacterized protein LOC131948813 n=1 Tax=Physella acuta TaxID=109671 RepID=UPI0027DB9873|nr:uncharacterized protein LOC131948813 [Physella acuta]